MNDDIKATLGRLAKAINQVLGHSEEIDASVHKLKELGYEFTLYLEATLLLRQADGESDGKSRRARPRLTRKIRSGSLRLSERDVKFLKSLRISLAAHPARPASAASAALPARPPRPAPGTKDKKP